MLLFKNARCRKRHDEKYKLMFETDPYKEHYQRKYEKQLIGKPGSSRFRIVRGTYLTSRCAHS